MTGEEIFTRGLEVQWSEMGRNAFPQRRSKTGIFMGWTRTGRFAKVLWNGYKTTMSLHPDFIEPVLDT